MSSKLDSAGMLKTYNDEDFILRAASRFKLLSKEDEVRLAEIIAQGGPQAQQAKDEFVLRNMKLVAKIAKGYYNSSMDQADIMQEGFIGLMQAVDKFDPALGYKFSTYATWWIRQGISRALLRSGLLKLPTHLQEGRKRVLTVMDENPGISDKELAEKCCLTMSMLSHAKLMPVISSSLDTLDDDGMYKHDMIGKEDSKLEDTLFRNDMEKLSKLALNDVSERDKAIFLDSLDTDLSGQEIGERYGISRERVRQIVNGIRRSLVRARSINKIKYDL